MTCSNTDISAKAIKGHARLQCFRYLLIFRALALQNHAKLAWNYLHDSRFSALDAFAEKSGLGATLPGPFSIYWLPSILFI
jgi:hypothetical protein